MSQQTQGEQSKTVTLKHGFDRDGTRVKSVTIRRQTWADLREAQRAADDAKTENLQGALMSDVLMRRCADLAPEEIDQLDPDDAERILTQVGNSTGSPTRTNSGT